MATSGPVGWSSAPGARPRSPPRIAASMVSSSYALACWTSAGISGASGAVGMGVRAVAVDARRQLHDRVVRQVRDGAVVAHVDDLDVARRPSWSDVDELRRPPRCSTPRHGRAAGPACVSSVGSRYSSSSSASISITSWRATGALRAARAGPRRWRSSSAGSRTGSRRGSARARRGRSSRRGRLVAAGLEQLAAGGRPRRPGPRGSSVRWLRPTWSRSTCSGSTPKCARQPALEADGHVAQPDGAMSRRRAAPG